MYDNVNGMGIYTLTNESEAHHTKFNLIKDIKFGSKNISLKAIILLLGKAVVTKSGQTVCTCRIADRSGSIDLSLWDELGKLLKPGDVICIQNAYATGFKGRLSLNVARGGVIEKIDEFCFSFEDRPYLSDSPLEINANTTPNNNNNSTNINQNTLSSSSNNLYNKPNNIIAPLNTLNKQNISNTKYNEKNDPRKPQNMAHTLNYKNEIVPPYSNNNNRPSTNITTTNVHKNISHSSNSIISTGKHSNKKMSSYNIQKSTITTGSSQNSGHLIDSNKFIPKDPRLKNS